MAALALTFKKKGTTFLKRIGIISDTHGYLSVRALACVSECDAIIHAGDIGNPLLIGELERFAPVYAVLGNNDYPEYGEKVQRYARPCFEAVHFLVAHYPQDVRFSYSGNGAPAYGEPLVRVCVHGHVHYPILETGKQAYPAELLVCPGSVSRPRRGFPPTVAFVDVEAAHILRACIQSLDGDVLMSWNAE